MLLLDVYHSLYGNKTKITKNNLEDLALILSKISNRELPWTWRYLSGLTKEYKNFSASKDLIRALQILANRLDDQSPLQSRVIGEISVLHTNGVDPGSIILGSTVRCAYCQVRFVPRSATRKNNNRYCCKEHERLFYNEKRRVK